MENSFKLSASVAARLQRLADQLEISREELVERLVEFHSEDILMLSSREIPQKECGDSANLKTVAIIDSRSIARGIAKLMAIRGVPVIMIGETEQKCAESLRLMEKNLDWMINKWELTKVEKQLIFQHIKISGDTKDVSGADLIFDTFRGSMEQRAEIYRKLDEVIREDVIIAVDDETCIVSRAAQLISNPSRVIGFHFTYPASRRKVVEIMRGRWTSDETFRRMLCVAKFLNKEIIEVVETGGAISTRVMIPFINEAISLWTEGAATAKQIDHVTRLAMNLPLGPLEYADTLGLDVILETMDSLWRLFGLPQFRPPARLRLLVRMGMLGKKTGRGIHTYTQAELGDIP